MPPGAKTNGAYTEIISIGPFVVVVIVEVVVIVKIIVLRL
jgi:hypothetical protein